MKVTRFQIIVGLVVLGIGFTGGYYLSLLQQNQYQVLVIAAVIIAFLTWFGSGADLMGLLREWYKDQQAEKFGAKLKIKANRPRIVEHSRLLTFKVWNKGGGQSAMSVTVNWREANVTEEEHAVRWQHKLMPIPTEMDLPDITQQQFTNRNDYFTALKIDHESYQTIELLFTTDHHNYAYLLDSNNSRLELGNHYSITLKVMATHVKTQIKTFDIDLSSWDAVQATELA